MLFLICMILSLLSFIATGQYIRYAQANKICMDYPNSRSSHSKPVVRGAGIIFVGFSIICWLLSAALSGSLQLGALSLGAIPLAVISFWDDVRGVSIRVRLLVQIAVSALFLSTIPVPNFLEVYFGAWSYGWYFCALFFMVAVINLYNFMDGIDGLVSLQGVTVLAVWCAVSFWRSGYTSEYLVCGIAAASIFGFLIHNWKPATVFMGDVGSTFIGYTIGCMTMVQAPGILRSDNFFILLILTLPVLFDATFTLLVRIIRGEAWYLPHKRHLFQRLITAGYSHATVSTVYGLMTAFLGLLLLAIRFELATMPVLFASLLLSPFILLYTWVRYAEYAPDGEHEFANTPASGIQHL